MKIHNLAIPGVFHALVTSYNGLSDEEAGRRLAEFGPNRIEELRRRPVVLGFFLQFTHFLAVLLWIAAGLSFLSEYLHPGGGMLHLGTAIVAVIFINAIFTFIQEYRAEKAVEAMKRLLPYHVKVMRSGGIREIVANEVVPGDVVLLSEGDRVPADMRIIESNNLMVNNAALTGESEPLERTAAPFSGAIIASPNIAFAGTTVTAGSGRGVVFATGMRTEFGRIAHLTGTVTPGLSPLQKEIVKLTRIVAAVAVIMGVLFFAVGHLSGRSFWDNFLFAVGIIVANVPEGLLPTVTLALAMGSQRMAKRRALIESLTSVEALGSVTVICTDKTGTITQNMMKLRKISCLGASEKDYRWIHIISRLCNNTREENGRLRGEPTEVALYEAAGTAAALPSGIRIREFPFDSERRRMSTLNVIDGAVYVLTKGAPESVMPLCTHCLEDGEEKVFEGHYIEEAESCRLSLMEMGLRVLAFAYRRVGPGEDVHDRKTAEQGLVYVGIVGLEDPIRPEVPEAVKRCREAGIKIIMITGDASKTALKVAEEIGLAYNEPVVIEGDEFINMSDGKLRQVLSGKEVIFSRMTPKHKLRVVNILKEEGERVAVTGDGVNDAPALKRADIGIAMGLSGTDVAKEAADMVLLDDNFATIVDAIEEGRAVYENIRKFIGYIFSSNVPEIVPYVAFVLFGIPLPLTILQILAVDLGTDMLPALALGAENPSPEVMKTRPRKERERLLNMPLLVRSYLFLGPIEAAAALFGFFTVLYSGGWHWGVQLRSDDPLYIQATTACLTGIIVTQVANVFACRSLKEPMFTLGFFSNRMIFIGIVFELILQMFIVYHPLGNRMFMTAPIPVGVWLSLVPFALFLFFAEEARKVVSRRRYPSCAIL